MAKEKLTDRYELLYNVGFRFVGADSIKHIKITAVAIDDASNDSISIPVEGLTYSRLSWSPLVFAMAFDINHDGHKYVVHNLYDIRAASEKRDMPPHQTSGCYQIE